MPINLTPSPLSSEPGPTGSGLLGCSISGKPGLEGRAWTHSGKMGFLCPEMRFHPVPSKISCWMKARSGWTSPKECPRGREAGPGGQLEAPWPAPHKEASASSLVRGEGGKEEGQRASPTNTSRRIPVYGPRQKREERTMARRFLMFFSQVLAQVFILQGAISFWLQNEEQSDRKELSLIINVAPYWIKFYFIFYWYYVYCLISATPHLKLISGCERNSSDFTWLLFI